MTSYDASTNIDGSAYMESLKELSERVDRNAELCAARDLDLSDMRESLRAQKRTLQALAITQSEQTTLLHRLSSDVGTLESQFMTMEIRFGKLEDTVEAMGTKVEAMGTKVDGIGTKVEAMGTKVDGIGTKVEAIGTKVDTMEAGHGALLRQIVGMLERPTDASPSHN
jgi:outer membrane murein-binding lipoprotein Lpp